MDSMDVADGAVDAQAFWVTAPGSGAIQTESLPSPAPGEVRVRTEYSGISRGTEALVFTGRVPPSEWQRMRAPYQRGDFPGPVKYGYANVGVVDAGPEHLIGRRVFVLYPHQTRYVVDATALHVIPDGVPSARAVLAANLETAINGLWDARPLIGDRIVVVGAGTIGCMVAWLATRIPGTDVTLVDVNPAREATARALGVTFAAPERVSGDADLVMHTSGNPAGLELALRQAGLEATIVEMSWYGDRVATLPLGAAFHARRLRLTSSQVGRVPSHQAARWTTSRRMQLALSMLSDPALDVLITGESPFTAIPEVMARLSAEPGNALCHRIRYR